MRARNSKRRTPQRIQPDVFFCPRMTRMAANRQTDRIEMIASARLAICLPSFARIRAIRGKMRARNSKRRAPQRIQPGVLFARE
jgi:hypothetical protein